MGARGSRRSSRKEDKTDPIVRVKPGVFALREWDGKKRRKKGAADEEPVEAIDERREVEVNAARGRGRSARAATRSKSRPEKKKTTSRIDRLRRRTRLRADLAASGAEMFDDEEDDDQPILVLRAAPTSSARRMSEQRRCQGEERGGRRRRRRRRRRGGRGDGEGDRGPRRAARRAVINPTAIACGRRRLVRSTALRAIRSRPRRVR